MEVSRKKLVGIVLAVFAVGVLVSFATLYPYYALLRINGNSALSFEAYSVHCTVDVYRDGELIQHSYHAGAVTNLGLNVTFAKLVCSSTYYNSTYWVLAGTNYMNITFISIGYNTSNLDTTLVGLPGEWNRTAASIVGGTATYNACNWTCTFTQTAGSQSANCVGLNFESGVADKALFCYDSFPLVTGIDSTFTITVNFRLSAS